MFSEWTTAIEQLASILLSMTINWSFNAGFTGTNHAVEMCFLYYLAVNWHETLHLVNIFYTVCFISMSNRSQYVMGTLFPALPVNKILADILLAFLHWQCITTFPQYINYYLFYTLEYCLEYTVLSDRLSNAIWVLNSSGYFSFYHLWKFRPLCWSWVSLLHHPSQGKHQHYQAL